MDTGYALEAKDVSCIRHQRLLFEQLSFQLPAGEGLIIEGPNGSGKSSLLRLLAGLATPASGKICWHGQPIQEKCLAYWEVLHYVGHLNGIKLGLTVKENLQLAACLAGQSDSFHQQEVLSLLQLHSHQQTLAHHLSAGQKRRLALAKLFLFPKTVWILDEPLTALDTPTQVIFFERLTAHLQQGGISILSSHHAIPAHTSMRTLRLAAC